MKNITLVTQETMYHTLAARALTQTLKHIDVDQVITFSDRELLPGAKNIPVSHFPTVGHYCEFMLRGIAEHITTDHVLFVQWDAMAYDSAQWTDQFLDYDYIGAPWPWYPEGRNVGNGGFSLRSRRLLEACLDPKIKMDPTNPDAVNEDQLIGVAGRPYLELTHGIRYPDTKLAAQFSYELGEYQPSFGCHGPWNIIRFGDQDLVEFYIHNMSYVGWNIHKWHHLLLAITERSCYNLLAPVMDQFNTHSPELVQPVVAWLAWEHVFWKQF